ncbi:hypothetical protein DXC34_16725 [Bacteroides stercoris]|uniref:Transmembrane protein n=1 Tax=Bacteroides stercoris TaxID=46506 RepID=A0A3E4UK18_BACSE|nr:hypothetical protein DXC34_16725 [Bacteroides stercoris]
MINTYQSTQNLNLVIFQSAHLYFLLSINRQTFKQEKVLQKFLRTYMMTIRDETYRFIFIQFIWNGNLFIHYYHLLFDHTKLPGMANKNVTISGVFVPILQIIQSVNLID